MAVRVGVVEDEPPNRMVRLAREGRVHLLRKDLAKVLHDGIAALDLVKSNGVRRFIGVRALLMIQHQLSHARLLTGFLNGFLQSPKGRLPAQMNDIARVVRADLFP